MSDSIVIDTNVLTFAAGGHGGNDLTEVCTRIIFTVANDDHFQFALDTDEHILDEYMRNLRDYQNPHTKFLQEFFESQLRKRDSITFCVPVPESQVEELSELGFDGDDLMFVRIAPNTDFEVIVSCDGESLVEDEYRDWIEEHMEVSVYTPNEAQSEVENL